MLTPTNPLDPRGIADALSPIRLTYPA